MAVQRSIAVYVVKVTIFLAHALWPQGSATMINRDIQLITKCICPEHTLTYQCIACGEEVTVWTGNLVLDYCTSSGISNQGIILRHRTKNETVIKMNCSGEFEVTAYISEVFETANNTDCYTSQINISTSTSTVSDINNKTVTCQQFSGRNLISADTKMVQFISEIPPPKDVHLFEVDLTHLRVNWTTPGTGFNYNSNCSDINFIIITSRNCGICMNTTGKTSTICTGMTIDGYMCNISIQTEAETCDFLRGTESDTLQILLKVPEPPVIINQLYSRKTKQISIHFNESVPFNISDEQDGSATTYFLNYNDPFTNELCGSSSVNASACVNGICYSNFSCKGLLPSCIYSVINVTVHALNVFGNGSKSEPVQILIERATPASSGGDTSFAVIAITVCGVIVAALLIIIVLTVTILIHCIKKSRNQQVTVQKIPNQKRSNTDQEKTVIVPEVLYADVGPFAKVNHLISQTLLMEDQNIEYSEVVHQKGSVVIACIHGQDDQQQNEIDKLLNLDTLLLQIGSLVTSKWYEFGEAAGVPKEVLDKCLGYPSEQCIIEVLDYWLRSRPERKTTWKDVAKVLTMIEGKSSAENILKAYETGVLPPIKNEAQLAPLQKEDQELDTIPPPLPPKGYALD